jgi:hypothetical protein
MFSAAISDDAKIVLFFEAGNDVSLLNGMVAKLAKDMRIPRHSVVLKEIFALPRTVSGKISYSQLKELC